MRKFTYCPSSLCPTGIYHIPIPTKTECRHPDVEIVDERSLISVCTEYEEISSQNCIRKNQNNSSKYYDASNNSTNS